MEILNTRFADPLFGGKMSLEILTKNQHCQLKRLQISHAMSRLTISCDKSVLPLINKYLHVPGKIFSRKSI